MSFHDPTAIKSSVRMQKSIFATTSHHLMEVKSPGPAALPHNFADFGEELVLVAGATPAIETVFPVNYQANQIVVAIAHATRTVPWEGESEEQGGLVDYCHTEAGKMFANPSAHNLGLGPTQAVLGTVAQFYYRILSDLQIAAEEAADTADFRPKDAAYCFCRSSGFSAPHP